MADDDLTDVQRSLARNDFQRPSISMANNPELRPVDEEGIPFMTNHEYGAIFGIGPNNSKQAGYRYPIPQYKEWKSGGDDRNSNTWFSKAHVVAHLGALAGIDKAPEDRTYEEQKFAGRHAFYSKELEADRAAVKAQRKATGVVYNLTNQPHPRHKNIHTRMDILPAGRVQTPEGAPSDIELNSSFGSNLENPRKYGHMRPVYDPNAGTVKRKSRSKRRGSE